MARAPENFAETVKEVRQQLGLNQGELAHELGVGFSTINRWENSKTVPFKLARTQFKAFCVHIVFTRLRVSHSFFFVPSYEK